MTADQSIPGTERGGISAVQAVLAAEAGFGDPGERGNLVVLGEGQLDFLYLIRPGYGAAMAIRLREMANSIEDI